MVKNYKAKSRLYWNADYTEVVTDDGPAAFLLASPGTPVPPDVVTQFQLVKRGVVECDGADDDAADATEVVVETEPAAPQTKKAKGVSRK